MNILQINTSYQKGGAAKIAQTIHKKINKKRNHTSFFAFGRGKRSIDGIYKFTFRPEIYLHGAITRITGYEGIGTYFSTRNLINNIENINIDLIHLHNIHGCYLNFSFINYLKDNNFPVVWTFHDAWPFTGNCAYFFNCEKWKNGCGNCPNLKTYPKNYIDQSKKMWKKKRKLFASGWEPTIITPSKWLADKVKKSFLKEHKIKVINNGVDLNDYKLYDKAKIRKRLNIPINKKVLLFVAADLENKRKGTKYFLKTLKKIANKNYLIITVGKKFKQKIDTNIDIKQLGYIKDKNYLSKIYSMVDLYCITSLDDNFPTTVLESLASGTPVVGFDVGGIKEQVQNECGYVVEPKNTNELAKKIKLLLENKKLNNKMSKNARKKAVNNYSFKKMVNKYLKL